MLYKIKAIARQTLLPAAKLEAFALKHPGKYHTEVTDDRQAQVETKYIDKLVRDFRKTLPIESFNLEDAVYWRSQAQGCTKTKKGKVVQIVPPGKMPDRDRFLTLYKGAGVGSYRKEVSYVVQVDAGKKPGSSIKNYWPRTISLRHMEG